MSTARRALDRATRELRESSDSPRLDAQVLLAHCMGCATTGLLADPDAALAPAVAQRFARLVRRRRRGEPIAYLTGEREFWSLPLRVSPATLIPRPETELLVERALAHIPAGARLAVADLGTGSGAVAMAIACERPHCRVTATDCSRAALDIARDNARRLRLANLEFAHGDWYAAVPGQRFALIVSNPPYVAADDPHLQIGDLRFEPGIALPAGPAGLDALTKVVHGARAHLAPGGRLAVEHGFDQGGCVAALFEAQGFADIRVSPDAAGHPRVTEGRAP
ncbi:MAG: peptide chain release factor N(5)-glutamine methyltransferase [Gammaproteobacteria bacterium]|nr:peptide chain release factor N(5)-glutamine methyltransferase [Gammaproteobacteria bacterium]